MADGTYLRSKKEAARYLGVSLASLERLARRDLPSVKLGVLVRFRPEDLEEYVMRHRVQRGVAA